MQAVALDANLLLLLTIGSVSPHHILTHKRLRAFRPADYDLLVDTLGQFQRILASPNCLTEVSNLVPYGLGMPLRGDAVGTLGKIIGSCDERYLQSSKAAAFPEFERLGLADCVWLGLLDDDTCLLTVDLDLYLSALKRGHIAYNFNHLREEKGIV